MKNLKELLLIASLLAIASSQMGMGNVKGCGPSGADGEDCTDGDDCIGKRCVNIDAASQIGVCASVCIDATGTKIADCMSGFSCQVALPPAVEQYCLKYCTDDTGCAASMVCRNGGCIPNNCTLDTDCAAYETCNTPTASCVGKPCTDDPTVCTDAAQCDNGVCVKL